MNIVYIAIMLLCFYPVLLFLFYAMSFAVRPSDGRLLGVRLSRAGLQDERAAALCTQYKRNCRLLFLSLAASFPIILLIRWSSIQIILIMIWIFAGIGCWYIPLYAYHKKLMTLRSACPELQPGEIDDDEKYWKYGFIYYNKDSTDWWTGSRAGIGTASNMARPGVRILCAVGVLAVLGCFVLLGETAAEEFTPLSYEITEDNILIRHLKVEEEIPMNQIRRAEVIEVLPEMTKTVGSAMRGLRKGRFYVNGYKGCDVYINPQKPPFLLLETEDTRYFLNLTEELVILASHEEEQTE